VFGLGPPLAIAIIFGIMGLLLMLAQWRSSPEFFRRRAEVAPRGSLKRAPAAEASFVAE
jgi:hypothetical protein